MNKQEHPLLCQERPWAENANTVWLASTISLNRNIENFKFPGCLSKEDRAQIVPLISKNLLSLETLKKPALYKAEELEGIEKEFLVEHFLSAQSFGQCGEGEAFVLDESGAFLGVINMFDHLQLLLIDCKDELEESWNRMVGIETEIGKNIHYSYNGKFGFLSSDPTECGTALKVDLFLQPSALIHTGRIDEVLNRYMCDGVTLTGLQGNPTDVIGDIFSVQNTFSIGVSEETLLSTIRTFATKIIVEENSARKAAAREESAELKDKVSRAYGILLHSYQIDAVEALNAISLVKLGLDLGWLEGVSIADLNRLFFNSRRAHLNFQYDKEISQEDILHRRAEYIHKTLKNIKLKI